LTPEEHFVAHLLLVKIHPDHHGLVAAVVRMTGNSPHPGTSNKLYGWVRRRYGQGFIADHTGKTFHYGTVIKRAANDKRPGVRWVLRCKCGTIYEARGIDLGAGGIKSCGCLSKERIDDLTGQQFGRWRALRLVESSRTGLTRWECRCECGTVKLIHAGSLKNGHTQSCGCLKKEIQRTLALTHGHAGVGNRTPTYECWCGMLNRCLDSEGYNYKCYGGRGITVCERWSSENGFANFLADMGEKPKGMIIDRKNKNGNYEPRNCRWATRTQQARNRHDTITLTRDGETHPLAEWAELLGIKSGTIHMRLWRGCSDEEALRPPNNRRS
jgi:hypothetical protein